MEKHTQRSDYSQPLSPSGDVFGYGVDPEAVAVHRVPQAAAGSRARLHASSTRPQQQEPPRQQRPQPRPKSATPASAWPSSVPRSPSGHPALSPAADSSLVSPPPLHCPSPWDETACRHNLFQKWMKRAQPGEVQPLLGPKGGLSEGGVDKETSMSSCSCPWF